MVSDAITPVLTANSIVVQQRLPMQAVAGRLQH
jgi:hypothetical protein